MTFNKNDIPSFFEKSFSSFKHLLEGTQFSTNEVVYFDQQYFIQLEIIAKRLLDWCDSIDKERINPIVPTRLIILSYFIKSYSQVAKNQQIDQNSIFTLAYFYDVLKNKTLANSQYWKEFNVLIDEPDFVKKIQELCNKSIVSNQDDQVLETEKVTEFTLAFLNAAFKHKVSASAIENIIVSKEEINSKSIDKTDSLEKVMHELNELVGLNSIKEDIQQLVNFLEIQKLREKEGLKTNKIVLHSVFVGPPGTGKTTVARLMGRIFKHLGMLSKGHLVETDREGLIAGYVGQTATKVDKLIEESKGGVLFIDEAYSLVSGATDYGNEAISTLLKRMEDYRDDLVVIVAGYPEPMTLFIDSNPGLRSRFNRYFNFSHFTSKELLQIFESFCHKYDFVLAHDAKEKLVDTFELVTDDLEDSFGNARFVRNLFDRIMQNQANRLVKINQKSAEKLREIIEQDIPEPKESVITISNGIK